MNTKTFKLWRKYTASFPIHLTGVGSSYALWLPITGSATFTVTPTFTTTLTIPFSASGVFAVSGSTPVEVPTQLSFTADDHDCTARYKDKSFSATGNVLYVGKDATSVNRSWMPFVVDFTGITSGIHIVSACLVATPWETVTEVEGTPCKLKVACDKTINSANPTTYATLWGKAMTKHFYSGSEVDTWIEGEEVNIDLTTSAKDLFGTDGITWISGSQMGILAIDFGSSANQFRAITSVEGNSINPNYAAPTFKLDYAYNSYTDEVQDTWISSYYPIQKNYNSKQIAIGEGHGTTTGSRRGLMKPDWSRIPATATVTSACLVLWLEKEQSGYSASLVLYPAVAAWDLYTTCWRDQYGTKGWDTYGAFDTTNFSATHSGSMALSATEAAGSKVLWFEDTWAQDWIDGTEPNYGFMLKTEVEVNRGYLFTSSQGDSLTHRPQVIVHYTIGGNPYTTILQD